MWMGLSSPMLFAIASRSACLASWARSPASGSPGRIVISPKMMMEMPSRVGTAIASRLPIIASIGLVLHPDAGEVAPPGLRLLPATDLRREHAQVEVVHVDDARRLADQGRLRLLEQLGLLRGVGLGRRGVEQLVDVRAV